jgi:hypothetical protein
LLLLAESTPLGSVLVSIEKLKSHFGLADYRCADLSFHVAGSGVQRVLKLLDGHAAKVNTLLGSELVAALPHVPRVNPIAMRKTRCL